MDLYVLKKDGKREKFSREKLVRGIEKCLQKRDFDDEQIGEIMNEIEARIYRVAKNKDIKSSKIGEIVINKLKKVDKVSYLRFAAVYKNFDNVEDFKKEIDDLS